MISYDKSANIETDSAQLLVNTVNTVGVMGAGVAKAIKGRYPSIMEPYTAVCESADPKRKLVPGTIHVFNAPDGRVVVNMATKDHWKQPSEYAWVGSGLIYLNRYLCERRTDINSVLLPPPGCGHGGLDWRRVNRMARTYLRLAAERGVDIKISAQEPAPVVDKIRFAGVGARKTPEHVLGIMQDVSAGLAEKQWQLRTGEAVGADSAFREGFDAAGYVPETFTIKKRDDIPGSVYDIRPEHLRMLRSIHPKPDALSPVGEKLMARNGAQVFGLDFSNPSDIVIAWTPNGSGSGGTGQAIRLAQSVGIPVLDLGCAKYQGYSADEIIDIAAKMVKDFREACGLEFDPDHISAEAKMEPEM